MSPFFNSFMDELTKLAKEKEGTIEKIVHHPATQAAGYGALAGEGAHLLADQGSLGRRAQAAAHSRVGRAVGTGAVAGGTVFLAAEGIKAIRDMLKKKPTRKKKGHKKEASKEDDKDRRSSPLTMEEIRKYVERKLSEIGGPEGRQRFIQKRLIMRGM